MCIRKKYIQRRESAVLAVVCDKEDGLIKHLINIAAINEGIINVI